MNIVACSGQAITWTNGDLLSIGPPGNKLKWNFDWNLNYFIEANSFQNVIWKIMEILLRAKYVKFAILVLFFSKKNLSAISVADPTVTKLDSFGIKKKNMERDFAVNIVAKSAHLSWTFNVTFKPFIRENDIFVQSVMTHSLRNQTGNVIVRINIS